MGVLALISSKDSLTLEFNPSCDDTILWVTDLSGMEKLVTHDQKLS